MQLVTRRDEPKGQQFALKELRNNSSPQARQRFNREIEAVKSLDHPSVILILDHSKADDEYQYYVMEYHEDAKPLDKIIFSGANPYHGNVETCLNLFEQIILAIKECENSTPQIVHRDINPQNVLVLRDDSIRLIDFGICQIQDGAIVTLIDENVGTRNYTSPECEYGRDDDVGVHSDIYSAAKVLWSAITSRRAFAREVPVFTNQSMEQFFPTKTDTWHLMKIFERTVREQVSDRCRTADQILDEIADARYLVRRGFPPLKEVPKRCPSCGANGISNSDNINSSTHGFRIFGNLPRSIASSVCGLCGFAFLRDMNIWNGQIKRMEGLS